MEFLLMILTVDFRWWSAEKVWFCFLISSGWTSLYFRRLRWIRPSSHDYVIVSCKSARPRVLGSPKLSPSTSSGFTQARPFLEFWVHPSSLISPSSGFTQTPFLSLLFYPLPILFNHLIVAKIQVLPLTQCLDWTCFCIEFIASLSARNLGSPIRSLLSSDSLIDY